MAPFDGPALAAAQVRVKQINAKGGVNGRPLQIKTCDTQGNKPAIAKACAPKLLGEGANVIFTTCDVDFAAPVVQESINRGVLAIAPCIGTDQMGPKRFGAKGKLAFSFGNVAQDEGSAMAAVRVEEGLADGRDRDRHRHRLLQERHRRRSRRASSSSAARSSTNETYQSLGGTNVQNVVSRLNNVKADVIVTSTAGAFGALVDARLGPADARQQHADPQLVGRRRHVLAAEGSEGDELLLRHVRVRLRRRPEPGREQAREAGQGGHRRLHHGLGRDRRRRHRDQARRTARRTARRSRRRWRSSRRCRRCRASSSFSPKLHTVFGRQYRVIKIQNNIPRVVGTIVAKVVPKI